MVGKDGFEPTQPKAADLQSAPALQLWRLPKKMAEEVGFEPTVDANLLSISNRTP